MTAKELKELSDAELAARYVELENCDRTLESIAEYMDITFEIRKRWLYEQGVK